MDRAWQWLRLGIALLLGSASTLKLAEMTQPQHIAAHGTMGLAMQSCLAFAEYALVIWLLRAGHGFAGVVVCVVAFTAFVVTSGVKWLKGVENCGCFGIIRTSPAVSVIISSTILVCLVIVLCRWRRNCDGRRILTWRVPKQSVVALLLMMASVISAVGWQGYLRLSEATSDTDGVVVLNVERWPGDVCPLFKYLDAATVSSLRRGNWCLVFTRADCPVCIRALPKLIERAASDDEWRHAFIDVPSNEAATDAYHAFDGGVRRIVLSSTKRWFVTTPASVYVEDGVVRRVEIHSKDDGVGRS